MRVKWLVALAPVVVTFLIFGACNKHRSLSPNHPYFPGDTIPVDTVPGNDTVPEPGPPRYNQVARYTAINGNVGGFYEALPLLYDSSDKKYPLLLFLHGGGELGNGTTDLHLITKNSLTRRLHDKSFPVSFTVGEEEFSFIILSPQFRAWPSVTDVHEILQYALNNYRVDTQRIYLSGLSMGGGATWEYAGSQYGKSIAAIVPICGASWADSTVAKRIAKNDVPSWAFHNLDDSAVTVNSTRRYVNIIKTQNPAYPPKMTLWPVGGHDAWTQASDPEYREDGKNMYEWMLQFTR